MLYEENTPLLMKNTQILSDLFVSLEVDMGMYYL